MLFLQFVQYSSSFVGTPKNEILGAALELYQLKIKHFSSEILKFSTKHKDNPFTLKCYVLIIFGAQVIKKKRPIRSMFLDYLSVSYDYDVTNNVFIVSFPRRNLVRY